MTEVYDLASRRPSLSIDAARALALEVYGREGTIAPLPSERDQNFHIDDHRQGPCVLKIAGDADGRDVLDLQNRALAHVAASGTGLPVPEVVSTRSGASLHQVEHDGRAHWVRMLTYLPGKPLAQARPHGRALLRDLGANLGGLDAALVTFDHPAARRELYWDLTRAPAVIVTHLELLDDAGRRAIIEAVVARWEELVEPTLPDLRRSVIYNDANDYNVLVGGDAADRVTGLVDFGDMLESATVCDPAIAAAYALLDEDDPLRAAAHVIGGYHERFPLTEPELEVLPVLIAARLAVSVCVSARRRVEEPAHAYLAISERPAWDALARLRSVPPRLARDYLRNACGLEPCPRSREVVRWLRDHADEVAPVMDIGSAHERMVIDLSVGSPDLEDPVELAGSPAFTDIVDGLMERARIRVGIGRYDEARLVYARDEFIGSPTGSPARRTIHIGMDVFRPPGAPVYAPLAGTVHSVANNATPLDYGPTVVLRHDPVDGPRFFTLYGHLDPECLDRLSPGDQVVAGARIARLGVFEVNGRWPPHLHLQIVTDLYGAEGSFPGVAAPGERRLWWSISPDPYLLLGLQEGDAAPAPTVDELAAARGEVVGAGLSLSYSQPLHIVRGRGAYLYDAEGRAFLDCVNNVCHVGHAHPAVVRAAAQQMAVLNTNTRYLHETLIRYARRLAATCPGDLSVCYLVNSGSEANLLALRLARAHTGRRDVVVLDGAYHGNAGDLIDVSPYKFAGPGGSGKPEHVHVALMPDDYRGRYRRDDPARAARFADDVRRALRDAESRGGAAALMAESILSCAGQIDPPDGYLAAAYEHARATGAVCIADEVQTGFGRVGTHFWAFAAHGVIPDIVTMGKPMANGHPVGAVVTTPAIAASFDTGMEYFNTFGGNPVSAAAAEAVLDVIEREGLQDHAHEIGAHLLGCLRALAERHHAIGDVRGRGLFLGVECVLDRDARVPAPAIARYVVERAKEFGVLLATDGPEDNVIKIKPPLVFGRGEADRLLEVLDTVLGEDPVRLDG